MMKRDVYSSYTPTARPQTAQIGGVLFTIIVVVAVLHFAQAVLMPLALAVLLAFLLTPIVNMLQRGEQSRDRSCADDDRELGAAGRFALRCGSPVPGLGRGPALVQEQPAREDRHAVRTGQQRSGTKRCDAQGVGRRITEGDPRQGRYAARCDGADRRAAAERDAGHARRLRSAHRTRRHGSDRRRVRHLHAAAARRPARPARAPARGQRDAHHGAGARRRGAAREPLSVVADAHQQHPGCAGDGGALLHRRSRSGALGRAHRRAALHSVSRAAAGGHPARLRYRSRSSTTGALR
jgi:hypothetical protein